MSMEFDNVIEPGCAVGSVDSCGNPVVEPVDPGGTDGNGDPGTDEPGFSLAIYPGLAVVEVDGEAQYAMYKTENGVTTNVTPQTSFTIEDDTIAGITADGLATGVDVGEVTVSGTYGGQTVTAQLTVVEDCEAEPIDFLFIIDESLSMGRDYTTGPVVTKLAAAKSIAQYLAVVPDYSKDTVGVHRFDEADASVLSHGATQGAVQTAVGTVVQSSLKTNIYTAILAAQAYFDASTATIKMLFLFTDGENKTGPDPVAAAQILKDSGVVICTVAFAPNSAGYALLQQIATAGFMASSPTFLDLQNRAASLMSFQCSGDCDGGYGYCSDTYLPPPPDVSDDDGQIVLPPPGDCGPLDLVLVLDNGWRNPVAAIGMLRFINSLKGSVGLITDDVEAVSGGNSGYGIVLIQNNVWVLLVPTSGVAATFEADITALTLGDQGTVTFPASFQANAQDEALKTILTSRIFAVPDSNTVNPPRQYPLQMNNFPGWRPGARRLIVLVTNQPPGGFDGVYAAVDQVIATQRAGQCAAQNIVICAIYPQTTSGGVVIGFNSVVENTLKYYASATGGMYAKAPDTSALLITAIREAIRTCGMGLPGSDPAVE